MMAPPSTARQGGRMELPRGQIEAVENRSSDRTPKIRIISQKINCYADWRKITPVCIGEIVFFKKVYKNTYVLE